MAATTRQRARAHCVKRQSIDVPAVTDTRSGRGFRWRVLVFGVALVAIGVTLTGRFPTNGVHYGPWSVVPPLVTLVLAFALREVITALFVGIVLGGVISGELNIVQTFLIPSVGSENYALILLVYLWSLGGLIGLWTKTGGAQRFASWAGKRVATGPRSAKLFAWVMGLVFHQGGTISTVLTGTTVRPVSDRHRVAHEELAYIVDSTASPAATLIPFNVWPIYVGGLVAGSVPMLATQSDAIGFFFRALPFNFYAIFAVLFTLLFAGDRMGLGDELVQGQRMADQHGVRLVGIERAVGLVGQGEGAQLDAAIEPQATLRAEYGRLAGAQGEGAGRGAGGHG